MPSFFADALVEKARAEGPKPWFDVQTVTESCPAKTTIAVVGGKLGLGRERVV